MNKALLLVPLAAVMVAACSPQNSMTPSPTPEAMMEETETSMMEESDGVMVGGAMMTPDKDIVANAMNAKNVTTLVAAVDAAGLVSTLQGPGPFTVFAPTNAAFDKLPADTVPTLLKEENINQLKGILTYHVVSGRLTADQLSNGQVLTTVQGEKLTVMKNGASVMIKDAKGNTATVETPNVISSNGVTHVIDTVLMPAKAM